MQSLFEKKIKSLIRLQDEISLLAEKINNIFGKDSKLVENLNASIDTLKKTLIPQEKTQSEFDLIVLSGDVNTLLEVIFENLDTLLNKKKNVDTFLSQTYVDETYEYHKKTQMLFKKIRADTTKLDEEMDATLVQFYIDRLLVDSQAEYFTANWNEFVDQFCIENSPIHIYSAVAQKLLDLNSPTSKLDFRMQMQIRQLVVAGTEKLKTYVLAAATDRPLSAIIPKKKTFTKNFPLKNFNLVQVTDDTTLDKIQKIVSLSLQQRADNASKPTDEKKGGHAELRPIQKFCAANKLGLITITKFLGRGAGYKINPLMDMAESKEFESRHGADDGISLEFASRFETIRYLGANTKWKVEYELHADGPFYLVLESLSPGLYHVLSLEYNVYNHVHTVKREAILGLIREIIGPAPIDRVDAYNSIVNNGIVSNMFLPVKADVDKLKSKAEAADPKYLRNSIHNAIMARAREKFSKLKASPSLYDLSKFMHDPEYEDIFSRILMDEYCVYMQKNEKTYETELVSSGEIYSSFVYTLHIYSRDFMKKMHDNIVAELSAKNSDSTDYLATFEKILNEILHIVITNESNIFQSLQYKLYLFKLSILDA